MREYILLNYSRICFTHAVHYLNCESEPGGVCGELFGSIWRGLTAGVSYSVSYMFCSLGSVSGISVADGTRVMLFFCMFEIAKSTVPTGWFRCVPRRDI